MLVASDPSATEPIAQRIIETPEILEQTRTPRRPLRLRRLRPVGSIPKKARRWLSTARREAGRACVHLPRSRPERLGKVAALAGRSPSYIVRQLYDMKSGARVGIAAQKNEASRRPAYPRRPWTAIAAYVAVTQPISPGHRRSPQQSLRVPSLPWW